ncbi:MAG TPA: GNAT family N-acetyltransferase [Planctomycetota bacterium]
MNVTLLNARDLTPAHWARWEEIRNGAAELDSPYFSAEFARALAGVRGDVAVAVLEEGGEIRGFFPHQRRSFGFGAPAGGRLSDFHGLLAPRDLEVDVPALMRACRLSSWDFHALVASQAALAPYHARVIESHYLDASRGLEGYEAGLKNAGSCQPRRLIAARRKAEKSFRSVEFTAHVADPRALDTLLEWKSRQYRSAGTVDNFSYGWIRDLVRRVQGTQVEGCAGMLSALTFDGAPAALHLGLRSRDAWHWWFPRHDEKFAGFSPGALLLHYAIEHAPRLGVKRIDLGYGDEEFKLRMRSGAIPVAQGRVEVPSLAGAVRRWRAGLEAWVRRTPLLPLVRYPGRVLKRLELWGRTR